MFQDLQIGIYRFEIEAGKQGLDLPPFYGSTLRGAFGGAFKQIACANPVRKVCHGCALEQSCPYSYVFETPPPQEEGRYKGYADIPRPFMFFPRLADRSTYAPGERLNIDLRLFGRGNDYLPYFVLAFIKMGERGLGALRKPFRLVRVQGVNPLSRVEQIIYVSEKNQVQEPKSILTGTMLFAHLPQTAQRIKVDFMTPIRLKEEGRLVTTIEFQHLARSLMRRASALMQAHHSSGLELDYTGLAGRSHLVRRVQDYTQWYDIERYSQRQGGKMLLGGVVGEVTYEGTSGEENLTEFLPLLEFGRWAGVGKNNVFGLGQMDYTVLE